MYAAFVQYNPQIRAIIFDEAKKSGIGAIKSWFVGHCWWRSGLETLTLGGGAALLAYVTGALLKSVAS